MIVIRSEHNARFTLDQLVRLSRAVVSVIDVASFARIIVNTLKDDSAIGL